MASLPHNESGTAAPSALTCPFIQVAQSYCGTTSFFFFISTRIYVPARELICIQNNWAFCSEVQI